MRQRCRRVSCPDQGEGSIALRILQSDLGVCEGGESVGYTVVNVAIDVGVPDKAVDHLSTTH
jgi:hypothetical protein